MAIETQSISEIQIHYKDLGNEFEGKVEFFNFELEPNQMIVSGHFSTHSEIFKVDGSGEFNADGRLIYRVNSNCVDRRPRFKY